MSTHEQINKRARLTTVLVPVESIDTEEGCFAVCEPFLNLLKDVEEQMGMAFNEWMRLGPEDCWPTLERLREAIKYIETDD